MSGFVPQFDRGHVLGGKPTTGGLVAAALAGGVGGEGATAGGLVENAKMGGVKKGGRHVGGVVGGVASGRAEPGSGRKRPRPSTRDYDDDETYSLPPPKVCGRQALRVSVEQEVGWLKA